MAVQALSYHEPGIQTILIQSSFILVLNSIGSILDKLIYCGLIGQILIGMAWGAPGAQWLTTEFQESVTQLGYLGLILIVFEGGLSTSPRSVKNQIGLSTLVAVTGVLLPIALSFSLLGLINSTTTSLQAFAAGCALCSTSLGTTFSVLKTSGLGASRLGIVLTTAAMIDDVMGLILLQVISQLGLNSSLSSFTPATVLRPVLVSLAFLVFLMLGLRFLVGPLLASATVSKHMEQATMVAGKGHINGSLALIVFTLVGFCAGGSYAGTSVLFAAYLAGAALAWVDERQVSGSSADNESMEPSPSGGTEGTAGQEAEPTLFDGGGEIEREAQSQHDGDVPVGAAHIPPSSSVEQISQAPDMRPQDHRSTTNQNETPALVTEDPTTKPVQRSILERSSVSSSSTEVPFKATYDQYFSSPVERVLKPIFFASIGFAIPIGSLFSGPVIWRGLVYSILMIVSKLLCGMWLLPGPSRFEIKIPWRAFRGDQNKKKQERSTEIKQHISESGTSTDKLQGKAEAGSDNQDDQTDDQPADSKAMNHTALSNSRTTTTPKESTNMTGSSPAISSSIKPGSIPFQSRHRSLYPPALLGSAMVARGEIGFLISALAQSSGLFGGSDSGHGQGQGQTLFLVVSWALLLCTILGPLGVGLLVRRVRTAQERRRGVGDGRSDPLGVWGLKAA